MDLCTNPEHILLGDATFRVYTLVHSTMLFPEVFYSHRDAIAPCGDIKPELSPLFP